MSMCRVQTAIGEYQGRVEVEELALLSHTHRFVARIAQIFVVGGRTPIEERAISAGQFQQHDGETYDIAEQKACQEFKDWVAAQFSGE
jgi:hypothetical protein